MIPQPVLTASRGSFSNILTEAVPDDVPGHWRTQFDLTAAGTDPVELRCYLRQGDEVLSETWLYQYHPTACEAPLRNVPAPGAYKILYPPRNRTSAARYSLGYAASAIPIITDAHSHADHRCGPCRRRAARPSRCCAFRPGERSLARHWCCSAGLWLLVLLVLAMSAA